MSKFREFSPGDLFDVNVIRPEFQFLGVGVKLYRGCRIFPTDKVKIGNYSQIDEGVVIFSGDGVSIGSHVHLATQCSITGGGFCELSDFVGIGVGTRIVTGSEDPNKPGLTNPTIPDEFRVVTRSEVKIEKHALVFTNSVIFPGVTIGEGAVVSAGSVVHKSLEPWTIYAGNPLVPIGKRDANAITSIEECFLNSKQF